MSADQFTADDHASVEQAGTELQRRGWQVKPSLNSVVNQWAGFVHAVARGYDDNIYEYTNDMSIRRWAEEARPFLSPLAARMLDTRLAPIDAQFRAETVEVTRRLPGTSGRFWWESRVPKRLVGELADDVAVLALGSA